MVADADDHGILFQFGKLAQLGGDNDSALRVRRSISRLGEHLARDALGIRGHAVEQCVGILHPALLREQEQTFFIGAGDREILTEQFSEFCGDKQAVLGIQGMTIFADEGLPGFHIVFPLFDAL